MTYIFDKIDCKILHSLDINARKPITQIAKKKRINKHIVTYRIEQYLKQKIITKFCTVENLAALGLHKCRIYLKFHAIYSQLKQEVVALLKKQENI